MAQRSWPNVTKSVVPNPTISSYYPTLALLGFPFSTPSNMASHKLDSDKTTLFIDKLSQPSRAVLWYCLNEKIPNFEVKLIQLRNSEHKTPEFLEVYVFLLPGSC